MKYFKSIAIVLMLIFFITNNIVAQDKLENNSPKGIAVGYWGNFKNTHGMNLGVEKTLLKSSKFTVLGNISLLIQKRSSLYTAAGVLAGNSLRRNYKSGIYFEHGLRFGYLGSYYNFDFYKTKTDGTIINIGKKWNNSIVLGYALGIGYDFMKISKTNVQLFSKANFYYKVPNNGNVFYLNNYSFEVGTIFHPKWFSQ